MSKEEAKQKKPKKKGRLKTFFKIFFTVLLAILIAAILSILGLYYMLKHGDNGGNEGSGSKNALEAAIDNIMKPKDPSINVAVFGVDADGSHTDVIFVAHFNTEDSKISLMSVPRDTRVTLTDEIISDLKARKRYVPSGGVCKLTEVHAYAGKEKRNEHSVKMLENVLDIKIDYYVRMNFEGFRNIVDAVDGVEFDVPRNMYKADPYINLKKGPQVLYGNEAEQLVRFRDYNDGDVSRVSMQQEFLKAFAKKVLNTQTLIDNAPALLSTIFQHVETDMPLTEAIKYVNLTKNTSVDDMETLTLPGVGQYVGKISYYLVDEKEAKKAVGKMFFNIDVKLTALDVPITILNGGDTSGLAGKTKALLENDGHTISKISDYDGEKVNNTRIIVNSKDLDVDLKKYFDANPTITVDETQDIDITIILGLNETLKNR